MGDIRIYNEVMLKLRDFFQNKKGFIEILTQSRPSILAACEDPTTVTSFTIGGKKYPLPQTGQMWLEYELLKNPNFDGVFCITTSYRDEKNIIPGRHERMFPMFEFESKGNLEDLKKLESELLVHLGFKNPIILQYEEMCRKYNVNSIEAEQEEAIYRDFKKPVLLEKFPKRTHPFWNMKRSSDGTYNKVDVLLTGVETIGSAERSTNVDEMWNDFHSVSHGEYAQLLFDCFGKDRVIKELKDYSSLEMFDRFGGGIGVTRLVRSMKKENLLDCVN